MINDAFEPWCWRGLLRVPWTARRPHQFILKEISPECSLEWLMLKLQYSGHLMRRADSLEKTLKLGKIEGGRKRVNRGWDGWMASPTQGTWVWVNSGSWWRTERPGILHPWGHKEWTWLSDWTELKSFIWTTWSFSSLFLSCFHHGPLGKNLFPSLLITNTSDIRCVVFSHTKQFSSSWRTPTTYPTI